MVAFKVQEVGQQRGVQRLARMAELRSLEECKDRTEDQQPEA